MASLNTVYCTVCARKAVPWHMRAIGWHERDSGERMVVYMCADDHSLPPDGFDNVMVLYDWMDHRGRHRATRQIHDQAVRAWEEGRTPFRRDDEDEGEQGQER